MSLFQCEECGCVENTALSWQGFVWVDSFDWSYREQLAGKKLCSACGPAHFSDGGSTKCGKWHNQFDRHFLPVGEWETSRNGNLINKITGETDYMKYAKLTKYD